MASNLLKTFKKIDNHRKALILKANSQGANLPDTASFLDLVPHIAADVAPTYSEFKYALNTEDWTHPEGWPDCKNILETAEEKDGLKPGIIMLLDATHSDEILLPKYVSSSSSPYLYNGFDAGNVCAAGYLLSDGTWYNDTTNEITHTWDTSKDIIVETGKHPGRYRWMILYFSSSKSTGYLNLVRFPAVEVIVGNIASIGSYCGLFITYGYGGDDTMCKYLKHIEFLSSFNASYINWSWGQNRYFMGGMEKLEHITFGKTVKLQNLPNSAVFYNCKRLRHIDLVSKFVYSNQFTLYGCASLVSYKGQSNYTVLSGDFLQLERIENSGYSIRVSGYVPENAQVKDCIVYQCYLPRNWKTMNGFKVDSSNQSNVGSYGSYFSGHDNIMSLDFSNLTKFHPSSSIIDTPVLNQKISSNAYVAKIGSLCYNLKEVTWPALIQDRISIGRVVLYKYSVLDLFEALIDATPYTADYKCVWLHPYNYDELTEEELAIATNKGWEVVRGWPY